MSVNICIARISAARAKTEAQGVVIDPQPDKFPREYRDIEHAICHADAWTQYLLRLGLCALDVNPAQCAIDAYETYCDEAERCDREHG